MSPLGLYENLIQEVAEEDSCDSRDDDDDDDGDDDDDDNDDDNDNGKLYFMTTEGTNHRL